MGVDLNGPAIEIAIALAFVFFLLSTVVSALTEGVAWLTKQRARKLEKGLKGLLGDNAFTSEVLGHALVQSDARPSGRILKKKKPSYLSARNFSLALIDLLSKRPQATSSEPLTRVEEGAESLNGADDLEEQLSALLGDPAVTDLKHFRKSAEKWFDDQMDRVSGWYKRWAQTITCVLAVAVAIGLNANAVGIGETLANDPAVRAAVVSRAEAAAGEEKGEPKATGEKVEDAVSELSALKLPLLWPEGFLHGFDAAMVFGWLITAIAISLGAPFWFDALSKLAHLRTTGKKPVTEET